jgi:hypothetical protein
MIAYATVDGAFDPGRYLCHVLYYDGGDPEDLSSYRFPVFDIVERVPTVVPAALEAAAIELEKADIPDSDKFQIALLLEKYFAAAALSELSAGH